MKRLALVALAALSFACTPHRVAAPDYGSGGFVALPPLQLEVFGSTCCSNGCSFGGTTTLAAATVTGLLTGATSTFSGTQTSTAGSGQWAHVLGAGARLQMGGTSSYFYGDGSTIFNIGSFNVSGNTTMVDHYFDLYGNGAYLWNSGGQPISVNDAQGLGIVGVATGSLTACNSTSPIVAGGMRGVIQYDTTTNTLKFCNGTAWKEITFTP